MSLKNKSQGPKSTSSQLTPSPQKIKTILRDLPLEQSFHFYEEIDKPTGQVATNLLDFCSKLASAESPQARTSLTFHVRRGDFATWIRDAIGDSELADKIGKINPNNPRLAKSLHMTVDNRIKQLKEALVEYSVIPEGQQAIPYVQRTH